MHMENELINYSPVGLFGQYIEVLFDDDDLWEHFLYYIRQAEPDREDDFYAYHREPECAEIWRAMLENMGGGWPLWLFAAAGFLLMRYKEEGHDLDAELERIRKYQQTTIKCPKCGSRRVAPILYGMPAFDEEMESKLAHKEIYLGGCMISETNPKYHCFTCGKDIASPPLLMSKHGMEKYQEIVTSIHFTINDLFEGNEDVIMKKTGKGISVKVNRNDEDGSSSFAREMAEEEWRTVLETLYQHIFLHDWKRQYGDPSDQDGDHWSLDIHMTDNRVRRYRGNNQYPPYWSELKDVFKPFNTAVQGKQGVIG